MSNYYELLKDEYCEEMENAFRISQLHEWQNKNYGQYMAERIAKANRQTIKK